MSLQDQVMIINLSVSQWSARKYDKRVSHEIEVAHNAQDAGRFNKLLIMDETLKAIKKIAGKIRTFHYFNTLPWGDNGDRILPVKNYFDYLAKMSEFKTSFEEAVDEFTDNYGDMVIEAKKRLNGMFDPNDYPPTDQVRGKFRVRFNFMPVQDSEDLRVAINDSDLQKIRQDIEEEVNSRQEKSIDELLDRAREAVGHMATKLSNPKEVFRDSLVTNIESLIDIMPKLNFRDDERIDRAVTQLETLVVEPESLRNDLQLRARIGRKAMWVLDQLNHEKDLQI